MFGIPTIPKFLVIVIVIVAVYLWSRRNAVQTRGNQGGRSDGQANAPRAKGQANAAANAKQKAIEDLVKCPSCGTYIASGSACGCGQGRR